LETTLEGRKKETRRSKESEKRIEALIKKKREKQFRRTITQAHVAERNTVF